MKQGKTLTELAMELERQAKTKKDYVADTRGLAMSERGTDLSLGDIGNFAISELCHDQISERLSIPRKYYDRMLTSAPTLLATNVNHWFGTNPEERMVRTIDGRARAFLSKKYRPLDNFDLAEAVLPKLTEIGCEVVSAELTERRMYIKAVTFSVTGEVEKGDIVKAGLVISNSEVGCGALKVEPMVYRLVCKNGLIVPEFGMRKNHVGRHTLDLEEGEATEFFTDETRRADDRAFFLKVRDTVAGVLDSVQFDKIVDRLRETKENKITGNIQKVVEVVGQRLQFTKEEGGSVLRHLIEGGDLSQYGMLNAVTRTSQDIADYDRATEFERAGSYIMELPKREWELVASVN